MIVVRGDENEDRDKRTEDTRQNNLFNVIPTVVDVDRHVVYVELRKKMWTELALIGRGRLS